MKVGFVDKNNSVRKITVKSNISKQNIFKRDDKIRITMNGTFVLNEGNQLDKNEFTFYSLLSSHKAYSMEQLAKTGIDISILGGLINHGFANGYLVKE